MQDKTKTPTPPVFEEEPPSMPELSDIERMHRRDLSDMDRIHRLMADDHLADIFVRIAERE